MIHPRPTTRLFAAALFALPALLAAAPAPASVIVQPVAVFTSAAQFTPIGQTIDQSGLSAPYTSGVTDFDTYTASTTHNAMNSARWLSDLVTPKLVAFDLGAATTLTGFAYWSGRGLDGLEDFELFADTDDDFDNGGLSSLGTFTATIPTKNGLPAQTFTLASTATTRYVHLEITSVYDAVDSSFGEFAFAAVAAVPEPASLAVWGLLGGLALTTFRGRRSGGKEMGASL